MNGRSAFDALVAEIVDIDDAITRALIAENEACDVFVAARQRLDVAVEGRKDLEVRVSRTQEALAFVQLRDGISDETVETLLERPLRR